MGYFGGGGGTNTSGNNAWTGTNSFIDTNLSILDDGDNTKVLKFDAASIGAGTTRTFTAPNANCTIVGAEVSNSFTVAQNFPNNLGAPSIRNVANTTTGFDFVSTSGSIRWYANSATAAGEIEPNYGIYLVNGRALAWATGAMSTSADVTLIRQGTKTVRLTAGDQGAGGTTIGFLNAGKLVEAVTAGSGAPNVLTDSESRKVFTNEGATAEVYNTLPTALTGSSFTFYCQDTDGIRVTANTADTIRLGASVSAAAGFVKSVVIGSSITLVAINATEWVATSIVGTWTVDA